MGHTRLRIVRSVPVVLPLPVLPPAAASLVRLLRWCRVSSPTARAAAVPARVSPARMPATSVVP